MKTILTPCRWPSALRPAACRLTLLGLIAVTGTIQAADIYKADNADNLNLGSSWTNGAPPTASDVAVWDATVLAANTVLLGADTNWAGIRIENPGGAVTISAGNTLTLGNAGIDTTLASQPLTLACPVVVGAPQNWNLATAVTVSGAISGTAGNGITNVGVGQINISGANNSFIDGITINAGIVNVTVSSSMPLTMNGGQFTVGAALSNPVRVTPNGGVIRNTSNRTLSGAISGTGNVQVYVTGSGTLLTLNGDLSGLSGTIQHHPSSIGSLRANSSAFIGSTNVIWDLGPSGGFTRSSSAGTIYFGALAGGSGSRVAGGGVNYEIGHLNLSMVFSGNIQNCSIVKVGTGTLTLDGPNTYGATTISSGIVQIGNGLAVGQPGTGNITNYTGLVFNRDGVLTVPNYITGTGGLTNIGIGKVVLTGANDYAGPTRVDFGTVAIGSASAVSSDYYIADYANLGAVVTSAGATVTEGNVSFGSGCAYEFDLGAFGNPTVPVATNTGTLTLNGNVTVNVAGTNFAVGTFTLLGYAARSGSGSFVLGTVPANITANLTDDTVNKRVTLTITDVIIPTDMTLRWVGDTAGIWDSDNIANQVWRVMGTGQVTNFYYGAAARFDDTATGTTSIDIPSYVYPETVTVLNSTKTYTFGGLGTISGTGGLTKTGDGTLIITNLNDYMGSTRIESGIVRVAGDAGTLGTGGVTNNSTLIIDKSAATNILPNTLTFFGQITGSGSLTYLGVDSTNSILDIQVGTADGNPYSGGSTISNGFVRLNANPSGDATRSAAKSTGFGSGLVTFLGSSVLELEDYGVGNNSAQWGNFSAPLSVPAGQTGEFRTAGRMTVSSPLTGAGTMNLVVSYVRCVISGDFSAFTGQVNVLPSPNATGNQFQVGNAAGLPLAKVHLAAGVTMGGNLPLATDSIVPIGELSADEGSWIATVGEDPRNAVFTIGGLNTSTTIAASIAGGHALTKVGTGTLTLSGTNNTYAGSTTISNGVLVIATNSLGNTELTNTAIISIATPGVLDVSGRTDGTLALGANGVAQTLRGDGTLRGSLSVGALGTVSPGFSIGTLTVTNAVTLGGTAIMELDRAGSPNSDRLAAPSITAGGTLTVTNIGAVLQAGDSFQLFSTPIAGAFAVVDLPASDPATQTVYTWTNRLAVDGTIAVLTAVLPFDPNPTNMTYSYNGTSLDLQWPESHKGWLLQTNAVGLTATDAWFVVPGSELTNHVFLDIDRTSFNVFYRLVRP